MPLAWQGATSVELWSLQIRWYRNQITTKQQQDGDVVKCREDQWWSGQQLQQVRLCGPLLLLLGEFQSLVHNINIISDHFQTQSWIKNFEILRSRHETWDKDELLNMELCCGRLVGKLGHDGGSKKSGRVLIKNSDFVSILKDWVSRSSHSFITEFSWD